MSEYHTQQLRFTEYENLYTQAQNDIEERDRLINRLEMHNEATEEQITMLSSAFERQNLQFNQVTNKLQSSIKQQEENHHTQIANLRNEHLKNIRNVASNFNNKIGQFKNQVIQQFQTERQNTKELIKKSQQESAEMINSVRQELNNKLIDQDQKIRGIQTDINILRSDLEKLSNQDQQAEKLAKEYINDLKILIAQEEQRDDSLFKKPSYCDRVSLLQAFKTRLNDIESLSKNGQNMLAAGQALTLYQDFSTERIKVISVHQSISEKYRQNLSSYQSLLNVAEKSEKLIINGINPSTLKYNDEKKAWDEETLELKINVDFWTNGKLKTFLDKHNAIFNQLNLPERERNHQIDENFIEKMQEGISSDDKSALTEYEAILKEAKDLALTSNLREVLGAKTIERLQNKYKGACVVIETGFELDDPKNNYHLRLKIDGIERHLILGSNNNDAKAITQTIMEGNDYNTGNQDAFKRALDEQIVVMNESGLKLESTKAIQSHSNACSESKNFITKGMSEQNKEQLSITKA